MTGIRSLSPVFFDVRPWILAVRDLFFRAVATDAGRNPARDRTAAKSGGMSGDILLMVSPEQLPAVDGRASADTARRFHETIVPYLDASYNFARFLSRDAEAAEDIVQEAFLRAYRHFDGYRGGDPRAWLFSIVRNCYRAWWYDYRRKAHYEQPLPEDTAGEDDPPASRDIASDDDTPEMAMIHKSDAERVRAVIHGLPEAMREILVLRELEDLSYRQIADIIDAPIGTVMSRLARARDEFGKAWRLIDPDEATP